MYPKHRLLTREALNDCLTLKAAVQATTACFHATVPSWQPCRYPHTTANECTAHGTYRSSKVPALHCGGVLDYQNARSFVCVPLCATQTCCPGQSLLCHSQANLTTWMHLKMTLKTCQHHRSCGLWQHHAPARCQHRHKTLGLQKTATSNIKCNKSSQGRGSTCPVGSGQPPLQCQTLQLQPQ